jgi:hypothetical protein
VEARSSIRATRQRKSSVGQLANERFCVKENGCEKLDFDGSAVAACNLEVISVDLWQSNESGFDIGIVVNSHLFVGKIREVDAEPFFFFKRLSDAEGEIEDTFLGRPRG